MLPRLPLLLATSLASAALGAAPRAQVVDPTVLEELRAEISASLAASQFASSLAGVVLVADEVELDSVRYRFDDDSELETLSLPFQTVFHPWGPEATGLYLEGGVGRGRATDRTEDLYEGELPGLETGVVADWTTYGGFVGLGPRFELGERLVLAPIVGVGAARIESEASYSGPGAVVSGQLLDGIALNWDGVLVTTNAGLRLDWTRPLEGRRELRTILRHDVRWTETVQADDAAQEFSVRSQLLTLRAELEGPTGLEPFGKELWWRVVGGYRHFLEESLFDTRHIVQVGGSLALRGLRALPVGDALSLNAAAIQGDGVEGWSLGLSLAF